MYNMFKGKQITSGEWIFGSLLAHNGKWYIIQDDGDLNCIENYNVVEETVCEETGLYNHGEQSIWEHDYVAEDGRLYEVRKEYDCAGGHWAQSGFILRGVDYDNFISFDDTIDDYTNEICVKIIGNKFDNTEEEMIDKAQKLYEENKYWGNYERFY